MKSSAPIELSFTDTALADRGRLRPLKSLTVRTGRIESVAAGAPEDLPAGAVPRRLLTAGLIDMHCHGTGRFSVEQSVDSLLAISSLLPQYGVTRFFPTLVPGKGGNMQVFLNHLQRLTAVFDGVIPGARIPGFHIEGPFVAKAGAACATLPGDVELLDAMVDASANRISIMSVAPDVPDILPVIKRLRKHGVVPFITHTQADVETTQAAIEAGARHATHFYDVFYAPEATDPGVRPAGAVEAFLADPRCTVDFIADGVHVHPVAIQAVLRAKTLRRVALITDAAIGAGMPPGVYETPWGYPIEIGARGGARNADPGHASYGGLSGSCLTLDSAINNICKWFNWSLAKTLPMATETPARILRQKAGRIAPGYDADAVLWECRATGWSPVRTWVGGVPVWTANGNQQL